MTDRELLEFAAKAEGKWGADFEIEDDSDQPVFDNEKGFRLACGRGWWGPLTDDGDALRLANKLRINIERMRTLAGSDFGINCWPVGRGDCGVSEDGDLADYDAATRRAIVRAAAIGKEMP